MGDRTAHGRKQCPGCQEIKPLTEFHKNRTKPDLHASDCKVCANAGVQRKRHAKREREGGGSISGGPPVLHEVRQHSGSLSAMAELAHTLSQANGEFCRLSGGGGGGSGGLLHERQRLRTSLDRAHSAPGARLPSVCLGDAVPGCASGGGGGGEALFASLEAVPNAGSSPSSRLRAPLSASGRLQEWSAGSSALNPGGTRFTGCGTPFTGATLQEALAQSATGRRCTTCGVERMALRDFNIDLTTRDGLAPTCRMCLANADHVAQLSFEAAQAAQLATAVRLQQGEGSPAAQHSQQAAALSALAFLQAQQPSTAANTAPAASAPDQAAAASQRLLYVQHLLSSSQPQAPPPARVVRPAALHWPQQPPPPMPPATQAALLSSSAPNLQLAASSLSVGPSQKAHAGRACLRCSQPVEPTLSGSAFQVPICGECKAASGGSGGGGGSPGLQESAIGLRQRLASGSSGSSTTTSAGQLTTLASFSGEHDAATLALLCGSHPSVSAAGAAHPVASSLPVPAQRGASGNLSAILAAAALSSGSPTTSSDCGSPSAPRPKTQEAQLQHDHNRLRSG